MKLFTKNQDFYPTPPEVISTMLMNENFVGKTILEPSAGSGNIVKWLLENGAGEVLACEKEPELRKLLPGNCTLIANDFLSVRAEDISHIDYIVMNPPFSEGTRHILHAFQIAPAGCTIIALCNSTNITNKYSADRRELSELIEENGYWEQLGDVFSNAERSTDVNVALIKLHKDGVGDDEFADYFFNHEEDRPANNATEGVIPYNVVRDMVNRYVDAVRLFDETMEATNKINQVAKFGDGAYNYLPIKFTAVNAQGDEMKNITRQQYKKTLQKYYWNIIFDKLNMKKYATSKLRKQINKFVEKQGHIPFTMGNIYQMLNLIVQTSSQRMDNALLEAFDLICSFSAENSTAGEKWKTNSNYMINRKFIVPYITDYDARFPQNYVEISYSHNRNSIDDVVKALCYITGTAYETIKTLCDHCREKRPQYGEWFEWGFFKVKGFKKGTMHFEFLDENVWVKFNQAVAKQRCWPLPKVPKSKKK